MAGGLIGGLPAPSPGALTLYVLGPGFGESQVVCLPDGRWLVVDCCRHRGEVLPLSVLRSLGARRVDLLAVTHPDLDHIEGLPELLRGIPVNLAWRYPSGRLGDLLARWQREVPGDRRLLAVDGARQALDALGNACDDVQLHCQPLRWPPGPDAGYEVLCLGPCPADVAKQASTLARLVQYVDRTGDFSLNPLLGEFLAGRRSSLRVPGNPLSLALVLRWNDVRVLLLGDLDAGSGPSRGQHGILEVLQHGGQEDLLRDPTAVKLAHHGSRGAFTRRWWALHAQGGRVPVVLVTPFTKGGRGGPLPHVAILRSVRSRARRLGVTSPPRRSWDIVESAGWSAPAAPPPAGPGPWVAVRIAPDGTVELSRGAEARLFRS